MKDIQRMVVDLQRGNIITASSDNGDNGDNDVQFNPVQSSLFILHNPMKPTKYGVCISYVVFYDENWGALSNISVSIGCRILMCIWTELRFRKTKLKRSMTFLVSRMTIVVLSIRCSSFFTPINTSKNISWLEWHEKFFWKNCEAPNATQQWRV